MGLLAKYIQASLEAIISRLEVIQNFLKYG
jgi:hypothetical protein